MAQIRFIRIPLVVTKLEFEPLIFGSIGFKGQFDHRLGIFHSGITAVTEISFGINRAKAVIEADIVFENVSKASHIGLQGISENNMVSHFSVRAEKGFRVILFSFRDGRGQEIEDTGCSVWAVANLAGPLQHLNRAHSPCRGRVIRRWRGVGSGGSENAVLHDGYLGASPRINTANTDIGKQALSVFLAGINAGYFS